MINQRQKEDVTFLTEDELLDALYRGAKISKLPCSPEIIADYEKWEYELDLPSISSNPEFTGKYLMPEDYYEIDVKKYLLNKCKNEIERQRVEDELTLFEYADKIDFLKYLIYLVDQMKKHNIVWGVGRGSSVSVFSFYLIGVHKVNSIKYDLEFTDFFKIKE